MTMYLRFHKGSYVDAIIPSVIGTQPNASPGDVVWSLPTDVNPSKTVTEQQNVQAVDPLTGQPLFNADGTPTWKTQKVTNPDGSTSNVIVTQGVAVTYTLMQNPTIFTPSDIQAVVLSYTVVSQ